MNQITIKLIESAFSMIWSQRRAQKLFEPLCRVFSIASLIVIIVYVVEPESLRESIVPLKVV